MIWVEAEEVQAAAGAHQAAAVLQEGSQADRPAAHPAGAEAPLAAAAPLAEAAGVPLAAAAGRVAEITADGRGETGETRFRTIITIIMIIIMAGHPEEESASFRESAYSPEERITTIPGTADMGGAEWHGAGSARCFAPSFHS